MRHLIGYGILAPPNISIIFCLLGSLIALVWRPVGALIAGIASLCLFVMATPAFASGLLVWLEVHISSNVDLSSAQAIVVPCADFRPGYEEIPDRLGPQSFERLVFAADAYRQLHLPVVIAGGRVPHLQTAGAELMKATLERYFGVPVTWTEDRSETTYEDAVYTARLLQTVNIHNVVVVTQARDEPRAIWSFERQGLRALPWPSPRGKLEVDQLADFFPSTQALQETYYALHELIGVLYYRIRY